MFMVECFAEKLLSRKYGRERNDTPFDTELNSLSNDVVFFSRPCLKAFDETSFSDCVFYDHD